MPQTFNATQAAMMSRAGGSGGGGGWGALAPLVFVQTVNPISTRGAYYAHHSTTSPPGFSDLATALLHNFSSQNENKNLLDITFEFLR